MAQAPLSMSAPMRGHRGPQVARPVLQATMATRRWRFIPCAAAAAGGGPKFAPIDPAAALAGKKTLAVAPTPLQAPPNDLRETEAAGPRGMLLVGFSAQDGDKIRAWFQSMEPGFVVAHCAAAALQEGGSATLRQALGLAPLPPADAGAAQPAAAAGEQAALQRLPEAGWEQAPAWVPPVVFFSGMAGPEVVGVLELWEECTGLEAPAFAAVTEGTLDKSMWRLVTEIVRARGRAAGALPGPPEEGEAEAGNAARPAADAGSAEAAGAAAGGEESETGLSGKVKEFIMLGADGSAQSAPMSVEALREQLRSKVEAKRAEQEWLRQQGRAKQVDEEERVLQSRKGAAAAGGSEKKGFGGGGGRPQKKKAKGSGRG